MIAGKIRTMQRMIIGFAVTILIVIILVISAVVYFGYKGYQAVKEDGLKGTAEQIWEGEKKDDNLIEH